MRMTQYSFNLSSELHKMILSSPPPLGRPCCAGLTAAARRPKLHLQVKTPNSSAIPSGLYWEISSAGRPPPARRYCNHIVHNSSKELNLEGDHLPSSSKTSAPPQLLQQHDLAESKQGAALMEVTLCEASMVKPASVLASRQSNAIYFLSNLDIFLPLLMEGVLFFKAGAANGKDIGDRDPVKVIKEALERVLVHYYPVAGRLAVEDDAPAGRLSVVCSDEGVGFAVADTNIEIADLGDLALPDTSKLNLQRLLYAAPFGESRWPLLTAQVTRFKCGGLALGVMFSHLLFDGTALFNFLISWGETARRLPLSLPPMLDRTFLKARTPLQISYPHVEYIDRIEEHNTPAVVPPNSVVLGTFIFTPSNLMALRRKAMEDGFLSRCTTFEALSGLLWKARTTAVLTSNSFENIGPDQKMKLLSVFDGRLAKGARIPKTYIGNGATLTSAIANAGELHDKPLSFAVKHVQDSMQRMTDDYIRSQLDYLERERALSMFTLYTRGTAGISSLVKLPFYNVDFGWGKPTHFPAPHLPLHQGIFMLGYGPDWKSINVLMSHSPEVMQKMDELLLPYLNPSE